MNKIEFKKKERVHIDTTFWASGKKENLRYWESNPGLLGTRRMRASDVSHYTISDVLIERCDNGCQFLLKKPLDHRRWKPLISFFPFRFMLDMCFMQPADTVDLLLRPNSHGHRDMDSLPFRHVLGQCKSSLLRQRQGNRQATGIKATESAGQTWIQNKRSPSCSSEKRYQANLTHAHAMLIAVLVV